MRRVSPPTNPSYPSGRRPDGLGAMPPNRDDTEGYIHKPRCTQVPPTARTATFRRGRVRTATPSSRVRPTPPERSPALPTRVAIRGRRIAEAPKPDRSPAAPRPAARGRPSPWPCRTWRLRRAVAFPTAPASRLSGPSIPRSQESQVRDQSRRIVPGSGMTPCLGGQEPSADAEGDRASMQVRNKVTPLSGGEPLRSSLTAPSAGAAGRGFRAQSVRWRSLSQR